MGEQAVNNGDGAALMKWLLAPMPPGVRESDESDEEGRCAHPVITACGSRDGKPQRCHAPPRYPWLELATELARVPG